MKKWHSDTEVAQLIHTNCHCKIIAGDENTSIEGYDPKGITSRMCDIAKSLNIDFDWGDYIRHPHIQRLIQQELITRDPTWVLTGKVPKIEFTNDIAKKNVYPHELEQAKRLSQHGIKCVFQVDYEVDEKTRGTAHQRIIGKPDLECGIELKNLRNTKNLRKRVERVLEMHIGKRGSRSVILMLLEPLLPIKKLWNACERKQN